LTVVGFVLTEGERERGEGKGGAMLNGKNKPYSELGKLLDGLARSRDVRGPYNIADYVEDVTGHEVSGQAVSKYLYGEYLPKRAFINAFADAFELTPREQSELAWAYTYGSRFSPT
jgi:hypothetical protein